MAWDYAFNKVDVVDTWNQGNHSVDQPIVTTK